MLTNANPSGKLTDAAGGFIALRSALPPEQMIQTMRASVSEVDPLLALEQVQTMNEAIVNIEAPRRFNTSLITSFALGALLLVITGIYAVVAFSVSLQTGGNCHQDGAWSATGRHRSAGAHFRGKAGVSRLRTRSSRLSGFVAAGELISVQGECDGSADLPRRRRNHGADHAPRI